MNKQEKFSRQEYSMDEVKRKTVGSLPSPASAKSRLDSPREPPRRPGTEATIKPDRNSATSVKSTSKEPQFGARRGSRDGSLGDKSVDQQGLNMNNASTISRGSRLSDLCDEDKSKIGWILLTRVFDEEVG